MRNEPRHIIDRVTGQTERFSGRLGNHAHGELEYLTARHLHKLVVRVDGLVRDGVRSAASGYVEVVATRPVRPEDDGFNTLLLLPT